MRNPARVIQSTWLAMLTLQTIGSVDAKHKLPAPKAYVAISALWGILFLAADTGYAKVAARLSVLVLLTASVLGPFGQRLIALLNTVSTQFAVPPVDAGAGPAPPNAPASTTSRPFTA